jgi:cathepsin L
LLELSEQNLIDCTYDSSINGCEGGWHNEALNYVETNVGVETQSSYPNKMYAETNEAFVINIITFE